MAEKPKVDVEDEDEDVSNPTAKKPKLDVEDEDEDVPNPTAKKPVSIPTAKKPVFIPTARELVIGDDFWTKDDYWIKENAEWKRRFRELSPNGIERSRPVIEHLCKLGLKHHQQSGETYEFVSLQKVLWGTVAGTEYSVTFCAKNLKADVVETFEVHGYDLIGKDELRIEKCTLLK